MGTYTIWGMSQTSHRIAQGITEYTTASHGGYKLSERRRLEMPEILRTDSCWFEEDCDWCLVALSFPQYFNTKQLESARWTLKEYHWTRYEEFYGEIIEEGDSYSKDKDLFFERHRNDLIVSSASSTDGDMVKCYAKYFDAPADWSVYYLVPKDEYKQRSRFGFVIDVNRHEKVLEE